MKNVKFTVEKDGADKKTRALLGTGKAARYQLSAWGSKAVQQVIRNVTGGIIGKYKGGRRTGKLRRSIRFKVHGSKNDSTIEIGSWGVIYARILERGGTIRPKRKQYLTIPLPGVQGVIRNYPGGFFKESRRGNLLYFIKEGGGIRPLFVLKKSVDIPAFEWLEKSIKQKRTLLDRMLDAQELYNVAKRLT